MVFKIYRSILLTSLIALGSFQIALVQSELRLSLNRDFGYGGFDNRIEGLFSLKAEGPEDLVRVEFYIDDKLMTSIDHSPFHIQFSTNSYSPGEHHLTALGFTSSGEQLQSNGIVRFFLTKDESRNAALGLLVPTLGIILLVMLATVGIPALLGRKEKVGEYGILGGTVCPKCGLPFTLKFWGFNWFTGKLQKCPHCGKWSVVRRASPESLSAAVARYRGEEPAQISAESREQRSRRQIDDSRYEK